mmetsp:Transcript_22276/g.54202  ORF Transcript_22276/g.54202 Transcript_22276/m.54202 type:complete len:253 (+) Transcript_22276:198-956(+)
MTMAMERGAVNVQDLIEQAQAKVTMLVEKHQGLMASNATLRTSIRTLSNRSNEEWEEAEKLIGELIAAATRALEARAVCQVKEKRIEGLKAAASSTQTQTKEEVPPGGDPAPRQKYSTPADTARKEVRMLQMRLVELHAEADAKLEASRRIEEREAVSRTLAQRHAELAKSVSELTTRLQVSEAECAFVQDDQEDRRGAAVKQKEIKAVQSECLADMRTELQSKLGEAADRERQVDYELKCMRGHMAKQVRR